MYRGGVYATGLVGNTKLNSTLTFSNKNDNQGRLLVSVEERPLDYEVGTLYSNSRCGLKNRFKELISWDTSHTGCSEDDLIITPRISQSVIETRKWTFVDQNFTSIRN